MSILDGTIIFPHFIIFQFLTELLSLAGALFTVMYLLCDQGDGKERCTESYHGYIGETEGTLKAVKARFLEHRGPSSWNSRQPRDRPEHKPALTMSKFWTVTATGSQ